MIDATEVITTPCLYKQTDTKLSYRAANYSQKTLRKDSVEATVKKFYSLINTIGRKELETMIV